MDISHPYLTRKGITTHLHGATVRNGELIIPLFNNRGQQQSYQRIFEDGNKRFASNHDDKHPSKGGRYWIPSKPEDTHNPDQIILIAEGIATAATLHQATGLPVCAAFNASNIEHIATDLRWDYSHATLVICADNDINPETGGNVGVSAAESAAIDSHCAVFIPHNETGTKCDFNDLGDIETKRQWENYVQQGITPYELPEYAPAPTEPSAFDAWAIDPERPESYQDRYIKPHLKEATKDNAAARLLAVAYHRQRQIPTIYSDAVAMIAELTQMLPDGVLAPAQLAAIATRIQYTVKKRMMAALGYRKPEAIDQRLTALPMLTEADYRGVILIRSATGTGKTQSIGNPFAQWARLRGGFIALAHRVSLIDELAARMNARHYQQIEPKEEADAATVCLPSITSKRMKATIEPCRYLFIDEISQVIRFLKAKECSTKDGTPADVMAELVRMIKEADCIIGADAGLDEFTVQFVKAIRSDVRVIDVHIKPPKEVTTRLTHGATAKGDAMREIMQELSSGGRVIVSCEARRDVQLFARAIKDAGYSVLGIHRDNKGDPDVKAFLEDADGESLNYDVVIHSPTISSGISIEHNEGQHFTLGVFIGGGHSITPSDAIQMMNRCRYLTRYFVAMVTSHEDQYSAEGTLKGFSDLGCTITSYDRLKAELEEREAKQREDFPAALYWIMRSLGWHVERQATEEEDAQLNETSKAITEERERALTSAPILSPAEAEALEQNERTEADSLSLEAHRIRQAFGIDNKTNLTTSLVRLWGNGKGVTIVDRFAAFAGIDQRKDIDRDHATLSRHYEAIRKEYRYLFDGIDLNQPLTPQIYALILDRMIERRFIQSALGISSAKYGQYHEDKEGNLKEMKRPKCPTKEVNAMLKRLGLKTTCRRVIASTLGGIHIEQHPLSGRNSTKNDRERIYSITADSMAFMTEIATSRHANLEAKSQVVGLANQPTARAQRIEFTECDYNRLKADGLARIAAADAAEQHRVESYAAFFESVLDAG